MKLKKECNDFLYQMNSQKQMINFNQHMVNQINVFFDNVSSAFSKCQPYYVLVRS